MCVLLPGQPSRKDDLVVAASGSHVVMPGKVEPVTSCLFRVRRLVLRVDQCSLALAPLVPNKLVSLVAGYLSSTGMGLLDPKTRYGSATVCLFLPAI